MYFLDVTACWITLAACGPMIAMASVRALIVTVCFARLLSGSARCRSGGCCDEVCGTYCNEHHTCHADDARCQNVGEACQLKNIEQQRTAAARDTSASEIAAREATSRSATRPQAAPPPSARAHKGGTAFEASHRGVGVCGAVNESQSTIFVAWPHEVAAISLAEVLSSPLAVVAARLSVRRSSVTCHARACPPRARAGALRDGHPVRARAAAAARVQLLRGRRARARRRDSG